MSKRMLIDATHEEETRVAVTDGNRLVEYDYESSARKPLKGNIYLAKVTRVEPSLQAAFVNYGGNRHGFLPFSEIHPDYFRIPVSDREALIAEQEALLAERDAYESEEEEHEEELAAQETEDDEPDEEDMLEASEIEEIEAVAVLPEEEDTTAGDESAADENKTSDSDSDEEGKLSEDGKGAEAEENGNEEDQRRGPRGRRGGRGRRRSAYRNRRVEMVGGEEIDEEQRFRFNLRRKYKIQEVIKRGQIMLVQVNKEERGNKGAAVGSYLSLPGRYCVLMPNSPRGGGVSRKIANYKDRARMREIVKELDVPKGMSVIVRTAGLTRTKTEIKRDLDYLMRLWNSIRELTLQSTAPALVYEEADLIKRSVRDLYTRDIEEIYVSGTEGFKTARNFMKMLIPSHLKKVRQYEDNQLPLFNRYQIESQIDEIGQPEVRLKSGGYLVINPTEALVSIDVNSGKATKERHIEETALRTNLEAADEVARQLKLRDLGGLVVIDFIDMEDRRNNARVERRMKEALSTDRARVQVGRISNFGLMELSRQRLSPSLTEAQYEKCPHCSGLGLVRTADAMSILVLRAIEEEGIRARAAQIVAHVSSDVALYILNNKRKNLVEIEERYGLEVLLRVAEDMPASEYRVEVSRPLESDEEESGGEEQHKEDEPSSRRKNDRAEGRRRGRRGGRNRDRREVRQEDESGNDGNAGAGPGDADTTEAETPNKEEKKKPGRRKKTAEKAESVQEQDSDAAKESGGKAPAEKTPAKKAAPSNDTGEEQPFPAVKDYETVNAPPERKKRGWWNRLVE